MFTRWKQRRAERRRKQRDELFAMTAMVCMHALMHGDDAMYEEFKGYLDLLVAEAKAEGEAA